MCGGASSRPHDEAVGGVFASFAKSAIVAVFTRSGPTASDPIPSVAAFEKCSR